MVAIPWPMGTARSERRLGRMLYRAPYVGADRMADEPRHRAEIEAALRRGDDAITQLEQRLLELEAESADLRGRVETLEGA